MVHPVTHHADPAELHNGRGRPSNKSIASAFTMTRVQKGEGGKAIKVPVGASIFSRCSNYEGYRM